MTTRVAPITPGSRPELAAIEAAILAERGAILLLYRVLLNSAPLAAGWEQMLTAVQRLPRGRARFAAGLDLLWATYADPLYQAALDLWTHARTDPELRALLVDVERMLDRQTLEITRQAFPQLAASPDFERLIQMALATARGLALLDTLHPGDDRNRTQWRYCRARLVELFEAAAV